MKSTLTSFPFVDTPEKHAQLVEIIEKNKDVPGSLVRVLEQAQTLYGYLPVEVQTQVADGLDIPLEEIYGVVSFYSLFSIQPKGQVQISVCLGTACYVKGAQAVLDAIVKELGIEVGSTTADGKFSLEATRCLGCCGLAPVMVINGEVYGRLTPADIKGILAKY